MAAAAVTSAFSPVVALLFTAPAAIVVIYGGWRVERHEIGIGLLVAFLAYGQQFFRPVQLLTAIFTAAPASLVAARRVFDLRDRPADLAERSLARPLPPLRGRREFKRVWFCYEGEDGPAVLRDISFVAEPGQTVALVGPTGPGKTTLACLIPRFYDVTRGTVRLEGVDVRSTHDTLLARRGRYAELYRRQYGAPDPALAAGAGEASSTR